MHAFDRLTDGRTDRQTDRILIARPRLHSMQGGKNITRVPELTEYASYIHTHIMYTPLQFLSPSISVLRTTVYRYASMSTDSVYSRHIAGGIPPGNSKSTPEI